MDCGVRCCFHLLEYCEGWLVVGPQLQNMAKVESSFLEMAISFQYFTKLGTKIS